MDLELSSFGFEPPHAVTECLRTLVHRDVSSAVLGCDVPPISLHIPMGIKKHFPDYWLFLRSMSRVSLLLAQV